MEVSKWNSNFDKRKEKWRWCQPNNVAPHSEWKWNHRNYVAGVSEPQKDFELAMASLWAALSGNTSLIATFSSINPFWLIHWLVTHVFVEILKWCLPGASVPRRHNLQTRLPPVYQKLHVWFQDQGRALLSVLPVLASTDTTTPSAAHCSAYNKISMTSKTIKI